MPIRVTDRWRTPPRGTPEQAMAVFRQWGSFPIGDVEDATKEVYRLCRLVTLDASLLIAHAALETGDRSRGRGFLDKNWATVDHYRDARNRYNIAGMGITDTYDYGYRWAGGIEAARAFVVHHARYEIPPDDPAWRHLDPYIRLDLRFDAVPVANRGTVRTVADMTGKWWTNRDGHINLASRGNQIFPNLPDQSDTTPAPQPGDNSGGAGMANHIYAIGMGHRNINYGGARGEYDWTPSCARALQAAINARGGRAYLIQEHDGDSDPNFSVGKNLTQAARAGTDAIAKKYGTITAILFCHYNGGPGRGAHFIYPDGWTAPDRGVDNPLDIRLARAIKKHVAKTNTVPFLHWPGWLGPEPGVMSERDTGAVSNRYGYRLGELTGTIQHRATTVRLIIEAGSIDTADRQYITNPTWVRHVYAEAIVDALEEVFGPMPKPKPTQPPVDSVYVKPIERPWADEAITSKVPFVVLQDKNHKAGYTRWWRVDRNYMTIAPVARQQVATDQSKFLNEPIPANTPIWVEFVGENYKGDPYGLTPWGTMVKMDNLRVIDWPNNPDQYAVDPQEVIDIIKDVLGDNT